MSGRRADAHVVTIRESERVVVVASGHAVHQIGNERPSRRPTVHPMLTIGVGVVLDARYGRVVHTTGMGHAK